MVLDAKVAAGSLTPDGGRLGTGGQGPATLRWNSFSGVNLFRDLDIVGWGLRSIGLYALVMFYISVGGGKDPELFLWLLALPLSLLLGSHSGLTAYFFRAQPNYLSFLFLLDLFLELLAPQSAWWATVSAALLGGFGAWHGKFWWGPRSLFNFFLVAITMNAVGLRGPTLGLTILVVSIWLATRGSIPELLLRIRHWRQRRTSLARDSRPPEVGFKRF